MYDYLIIGGGIAGTSLSYRLIKHGAKVMLMDEPSKNISSYVAAGIFNPITGKRTVLTWKAKENFDELHSFYPQLEKALSQSFFTSMPIYKLFENIFDQNEWLNKQNEKGYNQYINPDIQFLDTEIVKNPFGALQIMEGGFLDCNPFMNAIHNWLISQKAIQLKHFDSDKMEVHPDFIKYEDLKTQAVIFCDGAYSHSNPYFQYLPHKPVHGELIEVDIPHFYTDRILNKGVFILPIYDQRYIVGSTYNWDLTEPITTENAVMEITTKLKDMVEVDFKVTGHWAGIRPSTKDRRAYLGKHPKHKNIFIFGGFGSKGVSLIPYLSKVMVNYLLNDIELPKEVDICRVI